MSMSLLCIRNEKLLSLFFLFETIISFGHEAFKMSMHKTFITGILTLIFFAWYWQIIRVERCPSNQVIYMRLWRTSHTIVLFLLLFVALQTVI